MSTRSTSSTARRRGRRGGRAVRAWWGLVAIGLLTVSSCTAGEPSEPSEPAEAPRAEAYVDGPVFAPDTPFTTPIPDDPTLDDDSEELVEALAEDGVAYALIWDYGVPVYEVDASTPGVSVTCTMEDWGDCPLEEDPVRIPEGAQPSTGTDGAMVVIDRTAGRVYDFWQAEQLSSGDWRTSWGTYAPIGGDGAGRGGGATAAGINVLAGVVRMSELEAGRIDHALAFASNKSCPDEYRFPASKTDGQSEHEPCVPQGSRVQLDPSIDVESIPNITPGEVAVARALQTHGAYLRDTGQASMSVVFETPPEGSDFYAEVAGFPWDYYDMPHIPWDRLRVLAEWDGR